jgi:N6-adenosine-specific RNA methylase IME4
VTPSGAKSCETESSEATLISEAHDKASPGLATVGPEGTSTPSGPTSSGASGRYRTIVADPPWPHARFYSAGANEVTAAPYPVMTIDEIKALPVHQLSHGDVWHVDGNKDGSHLYLWTTQQFLCDAFDVARAWRFHPSYVLAWCKPPSGLGGGGGSFKSTLEFVVFARRGSPQARTTIDRQHFDWPRGRHSEKPAAFYDLVESVSPGPYLELFARRQRLGWDTWGNEALEHVELAS